MHSTEIYSTGRGKTALGSICTFQFRRRGIDEYTFGVSPTAPHIAHTETLSRMTDFDSEFLVIAYGRNGTVVRWYGVPGHGSNEPPETVVRAEKVGQSRLPACEVAMA